MVALLASLQKHPLVRMNASRPKLPLNVVELLVRLRLSQTEGYAALSTEARDRLALGTMLGWKAARCTIYMPGERSELGRILAVYDVDRHTGEVAFVPKEAR